MKNNTMKKINLNIQDTPGVLLVTPEFEKYVTVCLSSIFNTVLLLLLLSNSYWNFSLDPEDHLLRRKRKVIYRVTRVLSFIMSVVDC